MDTKRVIWLAGFIDADGCIRLSKGWKNKKGQYSLIPQITVHNVCVVTLNEVADIIGGICPGFQTSWKNRISKRHSKLYNISIAGIKRTKPLLEAVKPYLITKRLEAELLYKFINNRLNASHHNAKYSSEAYQIFYALKELKLARHLRDFTPTVEEILNQDKVRTSAKALEEAEMTSWRS